MSVQRLNDEWVHIDLDSTPLWRVFRDSPLETIVAVPDWGTPGGFLGVYPLEGGLLCARVYDGRALYGYLLEKGEGSELFLNAVADPVILWRIFKGRARTLWISGFLVVEGSYMVLQVRVRDYEMKEGYLVLNLRPFQALVRPSMVSPPSRVTSLLIELLVALSRIDIACGNPSWEEGLSCQIKHSLDFLKMHANNAMFGGLKEEVLDHVRKALRRCRSLEEKLDI